MNFKISFYISSLVFLMMTVAFQNCSDITVLPINPHMTSIVTTSAEFCAPASQSVRLPQKIVIVTDMSGSNISKYSEQASGVIAIRRWTGNYAYRYSQGSIAPVPAPTDVYSDRITALQNYLNTCDLNADNQYAVIGFSDAIIRPANTSGSSCEAGLVDKNNALMQLTSLKNVQLDQLCMAFGAVTDRSDYEAHYNRSCNPSLTAYFQTTPSDPFVMKGTSYTSAFTCMQDKIMNSLAPGDLNKDYKILFITDGKPSDMTAGAPVPNSTYVNQLVEIKNTLQSFGYALTFQPIYYGDDSEFADASARLNEMANQVRPQTSSGTPIQTVRIQPDGTIDESMRGALCNSPVETVPVDFVSDRIQIFSLTSHQIGSVMVSDKDMDGLRDELEPAITDISVSDNTARTRIVLDSLCYLNPQACNEFIASNPSCDPNQKVGFGFSSCDVAFINSKIINLETNPSAKAFDGVDYDGDNILDYIELIKGTNMFVRDSINNGDSMTTEYKLLHNLDPLSYTDATTNQQFNNGYQSEEQNSCTSGSGMNLSVPNLQFLDTEAITSSSGILPSHTADENVFVIFYFARPSIINTNHVSIFAKYLFITKSGAQRFSDLFAVGTVDRE